MPFGAKFEDGATRFRLWAPSARRVDLVLHPGLDAESQLTMRALDGGWFERTEVPVGHGTQYQFLIDGQHSVPDPASRSNPEGVHRASEVVDARRFHWRDTTWAGRPWHEAVLYELHVGAFTRQGTFRAVEARLSDLAKLGVTAIELMPVATFSGRRGWGYDGVLPFAPMPSYGKPEDLKELIQLAHGFGLMVILDVVYNHFGPDGNYLPRYAAPFFSPEISTPWGGAINFGGEHSRTVRDYFLANALYWLEEYNVDGLRLDAVHAIHDASDPHLIEELADTVAAGPGKARHIHLILENEKNQVRFLKRGRRAGTQSPAGAVSLSQWNDDFHHEMHVLLTGEHDGYYAKFAQRTIDLLARTLTRGFAFPDVEEALPDAGLFINFLQSHDQVGNRAFGERISDLAKPEALRAAYAVLLLAPFPVMFFMGEEFAAREPFLYFCNYTGDLSEAVLEGRKREFAFDGGQGGEELPDPGRLPTFKRSRLRWSDRNRRPHADWMLTIRTLLKLRARYIVPEIPRMDLTKASARTFAPASLEVSWPLKDGRRLQLLANLGREPARVSASLPRDPLYATHPSGHERSGLLAPWEVFWSLER
jgi:malto-oligosyltrehalose trehalohydrolase